MSDESGSAGEHAGSGSPEANVVTGGDGDGLTVGPTVGPTLAPGGLADGLATGGRARLGSVDDVGVAAGMHPDNTTTTVANIAATWGPHLAAPRLALTASRAGIGFVAEHAPDPRSPPAYGLAVWPRWPSVRRPG